METKTLFLERHRVSMSSRGQTYTGTRSDTKVASFFGSYIEALTWAMRNGYAIDEVPA